MQMLHHLKGNFQVVVPSEVSERLAQRDLPFLIAHLLKWHSADLGSPQASKFTECNQAYRILGNLSRVQRIVLHLQFA